MDLVETHIVSSKQIKNNDNDIDYHVGFGKIVVCEICKQEVFINEEQELCLCDNCNFLICSK